MLAKLIYGLAAFAVGAGVALQGPINAGLARGIGSSLIAAAVSFWVGTIVLTALSLASGGVGGAFAAARTMSPGWWIGGGLLGAAFVTTITFLVPKVGVSVTIAFVIAGQLVGAAVLDHFGVLGLAQQTMSLQRVAGIVVLLAGALMVRFS